MPSHALPIIGYHRSPLSQKFGAPRQPNLVAVPSIIEMLPPYADPAAFVGLEAFSHIWVSWQFHKNRPQAADAPFRSQVRPPRLGGNQKIGVFASRSMYRPSGLGLSVVALASVQVVDGRVQLHLQGADMIEGTPIVDIKPYIRYSDAIGDAVSGFAPEPPTQHAVRVSFEAKEQFAACLHKTPAETMPTQVPLVAADLAHITALIAQDPRPAYRRDEVGSLFVMRYKCVDVQFCQADDGALVIDAIGLY
ncbi:tRNA (N6-threonylcarbamoyladenosine(37)-N6)-methyltransferase TrmO [Psychrobacter aestuarii]|uniref:tRNA (N6-threonylcarbamoyladenosine(37)-N6)-methyltransferase TrmO n=1 Tax=Psychrobacter aestuarii TaxID=556327 RepID=A0ABN0VMZ0_9GAMM|nr:tRNA (N6-threonylcarbamoyladenosine(37)-N6)-methyltransferase TrmO [Psychrobacter aestuarii]